MYNLAVAKQEQRKSDKKNEKAEVALTIIFTIITFLVIGLNIK